jgi:hypothetical protein
MITAALANGVQTNLPVSVTAVGDSLYLEPKSTGLGGNYSYSL